MNVNNTPPANDQGVSTCIFGSSTNCTVSFGSSLLPAPSKSVVWCSILSPYYNPETNKCYSTVQLYRDSLHTDINIPGTNVASDYYQPYKVPFRESLYSLNLTVLKDPVNRAPSDPDVSGPVSVYVNTSSTYSAISALVVSKNNSKSMFASVIFAIKKVFAQTQTSQVYYLFDWNNDGKADYTSPDVEYGVSVSASKTWSEVGNYTIAVMAVDNVSQKASKWVKMDILVSLKPATLLTQPVFRGTYCNSDLTLEWDPVVGATRYFLQKNTQAFVALDTTVLSVTSSSYNKTTDYYNLYADRNVPDEVPTYSFTTKLSATTNPAITEHCPELPPPSSIPGISRRLKFYPNPKWAGDDGKCSFWGSASTTITDDNNVNYTAVALDKCYVDSDIPANKLKTPFPLNDSQLLFDNNTSLKKSIGKHTLYCNVTYNATDPDTGLPKIDPVTSLPIRATAAPFIKATCSKAPTFIEK
jgi:hypothetical protein